jgi:hypothetical protein
MAKDFKTLDELHESVLESTKAFYRIMEGKADAPPTIIQLAKEADSFKPMGVTMVAVPKDVSIGVACAAIAKSMIEDEGLTKVLFVCEGWSKNPANPSETIGEVLMMNLFEKGGGVTARSWLIKDKAKGEFEPMFDSRVEGALVAGRVRDTFVGRQ